MIKKIVHFSDLHLRLFKDHDLYKRIITDMLNKFKDIKPDRIVFTGDLVHSKNQMTPELIEVVAWILTECSSISKTVLIPGNHDFLNNNLNRLDALTPIIHSLKNPEIVYYRDRGIYEDDNKISEVLKVILNTTQNNLGESTNEIFTRSAELLTRREKK